jgi:O-antigen/teichoic acid export membrane protein
MASAFFLAGDHVRDVRLRPTLSSMAIVGSVLGMLAWLVCVGPFNELFFKQMPPEMVAVMAITVATQLLTVTAKGCCQGSGDIAGANLVIVAEELWFVLCYPVVLMLSGDHGVNSVVAALIVSGGLSTLTALWRLRQRGFFAGWGQPSVALAKRVAAFGARGQLGNLLWLMNLRLDFIIIAALAGPAELGIYAIASKFAELMRLVPTAINYVLYPRFANLDQERATSEARRLLPRAAALTLLMAPFLAVFCYFTLPLLYGEAFRPAVAPAEIIIIGLSIEGAAAVASAYLLGSGRPGLNSVAMGCGLAITVVLDLLLIPRYGAVGAAITSAVSYSTSTVVLVVLFHWIAGPRGGSDPGLLAFALEDSDR